MIIDIDGLRVDVFQNALRSGQLPVFSRLFGDEDTVHLQAVSTAPSITFCSQTSIFTGLHPNVHGIVGNQFFDRFGRGRRQTPEFYALDVGETLELDDAVKVFLGKGLLARLISPESPTLYEVAEENGFDSVVVHHMLARGAQTWIKPTLAAIGRLTKGKGPVKLTAERYDKRMVNKVLRHLDKKGFPGLLTIYFLGLDHESHHYGTSIQQEYLQNIIDPQVGRIVERLEQMGIMENLLVVVVSDHGQYDVLAEDRHSLRLSFPFDREMGYLFDALGLDVHDFPGEDPNCDAVVACNGGMAHVYLQHRNGHWRDKPRFREDILPVAFAFWEANQTGKYAEDLKAALAAILVRDVENEGWQGGYQVYQPEGFVTLEQFFLTRHDFKQVGAMFRIEKMTCPGSGDLVLLSNYPEHYYFGPPVKGVHGGLHPDDSLSVFSLSWLGKEPGFTLDLNKNVRDILEKRMNQEKRDFVSVVDVTPVICGIMGWSGFNR